MNGGTQDGRSDDSGRIEVRNLTKRFGRIEAVRDLSFTVHPGQVTGFLGPNGAGKTTTLRTLLGLVMPTEGDATIGGRRFDELPHPGRTVGAVLDAGGFHAGRTARAHLRVYTAAIGVPDSRAEETLALVGLTDAANRKVGGFSLGMRQRLALATALLGEPRVLVLDEPGSGLDPEGVAWLRGFLKSYAAGGRTVLVSSHQLSEMALTADHLVIISQGSRVFEGGMDELGGDGGTRVRVRVSDPARLATVLAEEGITDIRSASGPAGEGWLTVAGAPATAVGDAALKAEVAVYGMSEERTDLEQRFLALTTGHYQGQQQGGPPAAGSAPAAPPPATTSPAGSSVGSGVGHFQEGSR